jgi:hypothetical protein
MCMKSVKGKDLIRLFLQLQIIRSSHITLNIFWLKNLFLKKLIFCCFCSLRVIHAWDTQHVMTIDQDLTLRPEAQTLCTCLEKVFFCVKSFCLDLWSKTLKLINVLTETNTSQKILKSFENILSSLGPYFFVLAKYCKIIYFIDITRNNNSS